MTEAGSIIQGKIRKHTAVGKTPLLHKRRIVLNLTKDEVNPAPAALSTGGGGGAIVRQLAADCSPQEVVAVQESRCFKALRCGSAGREHRIRQAK